MKNILFPTDYSDSATNAFIYALKVAQKMNAKITTLHVSQMPVLEIEGKVLAESLERINEAIEMEEFGEYKDRLTQLKAIAKREGLEHIPLQHILQGGKVIPTIIKVAEENTVDLIIMGTKGAGFLKEVFIGSNAAEILENANCPVLAVPEKAIFDGKIDKIAVTTKFQKKEIKAIHKVLEFAAWFDAIVHVIHVDISYTHAYTNNMDKLKEALKDYDDALKFTVLDGTNLVEKLSRHLEMNSFDLVAMSTHKRNFIQELFNYSKAKSMVYQHNVPVLSIPTHILG